MSVVYALFNDPAQARAALRELDLLVTVGKELDVRVHDEEPDIDTMSISESGMKRGVIDGLVFGSLGAGVLVALLGWFGVIPGAIFPGALVAVLFGGMYGLFVGLMAGTSCPDRNLERLASRKRSQGLLLTVESSDPDMMYEADHILRERGALLQKPETL